MTLADEIRAEFARIIQRNYGLPNALGAVRIETAEKVLAFVDEAESRRCTCSQDRGFEIPIHRTDARSYRAMEQARIDRMLFEDRAAGWEA